MIANVYKNAKYFYWYPLKFNFQGFQIDSIKETYYFNNGTRFNGHSFLYQAMDYANNNQTSLVLTDVLSSSDIFKIKEQPKDSNKLTEIISTISVNTGFVVSPFTDSVKKYLQVSNRTKFSDVDVLKFKIDPTNNDLLYIENKEGLVLQCDGVGEYLTYFSLKIEPEADKQRFEYFLNDDGNIILFLAGSNNKKILSYSKNGLLYFNDITLNKQEFRIQNENIFKLNSYKKLNVNKNYINNSKVVEYISTPIEPIDSLIKDTTVTSNEYSQNFLLMFPTESPSIINDEANYNVDYCGLKNYQNINYDYTKGPYFVEDNPYIRRLYWKIHTGTNQQTGYDEIYLSYTSNSTKISFPSDRETEFQYPPTSPRVELKNANLIESGAISGEHPISSDRIYGLSINYKDTLPGLSQPVSFFRETGTWLCSWLRRMPNGKSQWVDRYYNSAYHTLDTALSADYFQYFDRLDPKKPYVYDVESNLMLEPGARYKYFRQGLNSSKQFLNYLDYTTETSYGSKTLHINKWNGSYLDDISKYEHDGIIVGSNSIQPSPNHFVLNGSNHAIFPATSDLLENKKLTVSLWLNVDNWSNIYGWQIFGNYYDGGWGLINDNGQISPILTFTENKQRRTYSLNYRAGSVNSFDFSNYPNANFEWIISLPNFNYWFVDTNNNLAYRVDCNGKLLNNDLNNIKKYITKIDYVTVDRNLNLHIFDRNNGVILIISETGNFVKEIEGVYKEKIDFRSDNSIVYCDSYISVIDNDDNLWDIVGQNLYKLTDYNSSQKIYTNRTVKAYIDKCQSITCDSDNNIWLITKNNTLLKFNTTTEKFEVNKKLIDDFVPVNQTKQYSYIGIIRTSSTEFYKDCLDLQKPLYDVVVVVDSVNFKLYYFQTTGEILKKIDIRSYIENDELKFNTDWNFSAKGDITGFDYLRKFNNPSLKNITWNVKTSDNLKEKFNVLTLKHNVSSLPSGWHHFCLSFDGLEGNCTYYIDSIKVDTKTFAKNSILYYNFLSPLLLGSSTVRSTSLNDLVKIEDGYKFKGKVSELMIYNKTLNSSEVEQLYFSDSKSLNRDSLNWNIYVGERDYIEKINHFFKYQLPGNKSNYYNINIHNLNVSRTIKNMIENDIRQNINKISPYNTFLNKINWL